jgi:hypothetical protein
MAVQSDIEVVPSHRYSWLRLEGCARRRGRRQDGAASRPSREPPKTSTQTTAG